MKRIIYLLAISCFLLISCHDDDRFSVENVVGNNTSIVGMWLREAGKEQMVYAFFEDGTGYEKTTDRRNITNMKKEEKKFVTEYQINGKKYAGEIWATSWEEAESFIKQRASTEKVVGFIPKD